MGYWNEINQQFIFNYTVVFPMFLVSRTCLAVKPLKRLCRTLGFDRTQVKNHYSNVFHDRGMVSLIT